MPVAAGESRLTLPHGAGLKRGLYTADARTFYTAGGHRLCLWDVTSGKLLSEFDAVTDCRLTPDGRFLLGIRPSTLAVVIDASSGAFVRDVIPSLRRSHSPMMERILSPSVRMEWPELGTSPRGIASRLRFHSGATQSVAPSVVTAR